MEPDRKTAENALQFIRRSVPPNLLQIMTYILQKDFWGHALRYSLLFYEIMADMQRKYSIFSYSDNGTWKYCVANSSISSSNGANGSECTVIPAPKSI